MGRIDSEWAQSLVGKEWEIFWESSDGEDASDWYDGKVVSFKKGQFQVSFVGDDNVYDMKLEPSLVRPAVRAWINRTKAILKPQHSFTSMGVWETQLPQDTSMLEDEETLEELENDVCEEDRRSGRRSRSEVPLATKQQRYQMHRLHYLVRAQVYLRTKLAKVENDDAEKGEDEPTESFINHLLEYLKYLESLCVWHEKCWLLQQQVLGEGADTSEQLDVKDVEEGCISSGRDQIMKVLDLDVSSGGKRQATTPCARRVKRRRTQRDQKAQVVETDDVLLEDADLVDFSSVEDFVQRLRNLESQWFLEPCAAMMLAISFHIHNPLQQWKSRTLSMLQKNAISYDTNKKEEKNDGGDETKNEEAIGKDVDGDVMMTEVPTETFTYTDIKTAIDTVKEDKILKQFVLASWTLLLEAKLKCIEDVESQVLDCIGHVEDTPETDGTDSVLAALKDLKQKISSKETGLSNVSPLGTEPGSQLTKKVVDDAIIVRRWVINRATVEKTRQRISFVKRLIEDAQSLPQLPSVNTNGSKLADLRSSVENLSEELKKHEQTTKKYEKQIDARKSKALMKSEEIDQALQELQEMPFVSLAEEKLLVRLAIINWESNAKEAVDDDMKSPIEYTVLREQHEQLKAVLEGNSIAGHQTLDDDDSGKKIRAFADQDARRRCRPLVAYIQQKYAASTTWKENVDALAESLRAHGNELAGDSMELAEPPAMVELKRVSDMLDEYEGMKVLFPEYHAMLAALHESATTWQEEIDAVIFSSQKIHNSLQKANEARPKGLIIDPDLEVVESVTKTLHWHDKLKVAVSELVEKPDGTLTLVDHLKVVSEGIEIVEKFTAVNCSGEKYHVDSKDINSVWAELNMLEAQQNVLSLAQIESFDFGGKVVSRMIDPSFDSQQGHPLVYATYICWRACLESMLQRSMATKLEVGKRPSVSLASKLLEMEPKTGDTVLDEALCNVDSESLKKFKGAIKEGEDIELATRRLLEGKKEMFRGTFKNAQRFREYASKIKEAQSQFKGRHSSGLGLVLNNELEHQLEGVGKDVTWLLRTLPYKALHQDDILDDDEDIKPLSWDVLVSLFERTPAHSDDGSFGDIARVSIRVRELHEAATQWQEEVTALLPLSIRGAKRRIPNGGQPDTEGHSKVNMAKLSELAEDPILRKVVMPRESAVREVLHRANEFESMLYKLLGEDYEGDSSDKAPYPSSTSLLGSRGEFLLYRLTGSSLFMALKHTIEQMTPLAAEVAADTPGKAIFDWIGRAVRWIESLRDIVSTKSPFGGDKLILPLNEAHRMLQLGNQLFLDVSEEIRKTLSNHKIFMTTNKQTAKLTVTISKGGAHHSVGGTAIKWCPLLLEWLKKDIASTEDWETRVAGNAQRFNEVAGPLMLRSDLDLMGVYRVYRFREQAQLLLDEGMKRLVVNPRDHTVHATIQLRDALDTWARERAVFSNGAISFEALVKQRYVEPETIFLDRNDLLESLLNRKRLHAAANGKKSSAPLNIDTKSYRDKARTILEKGLRKGFKMMGIKLANNSEVAMHCTIKAFEIENGVFRLYQGEGKPSVTSEYRDQIKAIKANLEDFKNPTLSARLLANKLPVEELVQMSPEQMKTAFIAKKAIKKEKPAKSPDAKKSLKNLVSKASPSPSVEEKESTGNSGLPRPPDLGSPMKTRGSGGRSSSPSMPTPPSLAAPPSLASLPVLPTKKPSSPIARTSELITNENGGDQFSITIGDPKVTFRTEMYLDNGLSSSDVDGFLPEIMVEKGRLPIDEYVKFVVGKMKGGRWEAVALRLSVLQRSTNEYRTFYKEYEQRKRISMISVKDTKVFLVTPKFHGAAKTIRDQLHSKTHTYAVVLKKKSF